jgi:hypothetical protein
MQRFSSKKDERMKVLFAFGVHGDPTTQIPCDTAFFGGSVTPWVERIVASGGKITIIDEQNHASAYLVSDDELLFHARFLAACARSENPARSLIEQNIDPELFASIHSSVIERETMICNFYATTLNVGIYKEGELYELGYEMACAELNRRFPGSITFVTEHQSVDAILASIRYDLTINRLSDGGKDDPIALAKAIIAAKAEMVYTRDHSLRLQVEALRMAIPTGEKARHSIVIPRGLFHIGMLGLFDSDLFDVTVFPEDITAARSRLITERPETLAIFDRYNGTVSDEQLTHCANQIVSAILRDGTSSK